MKKPLKILVACDSFKGSLTSAEIIGVLKAVAKESFDGVDVFGAPVADGGEGTLDALISTGRFQRVTVICKNPLFEDISADYAVNGDCAVIEMAAASGLTLIPYKDGNAAITTTYGTGQLIAAAIKGGAKNIFVSVGGSATNDGGVGALSALGYVFKDKDGNPLLPVGKNLALIKTVDNNNVVVPKDVNFTVIADVDNPLLGARGATRFYGAQKGATGAVSAALEDGMKNYADVVKSVTGVSLHNMPRSGAAGGLSGGLIAFLNAKVQSGIKTVLEMTGFSEALENADAVITGEGRLDEQSFHGKAVSGVAEAARVKGVPTYVFVGGSAISTETLKNHGISGIQTLSGLAASTEDAIINAKKYAKIAAKMLISLIIKDFNNK